MPLPPENEPLSTPVRRLLTILEEALGAGVFHLPGSNKGPSPLNGGQRLSPHKKSELLALLYFVFLLVSC